ncbi:MAG: hypothetical protein J7K21_05170 [Desulfurococcales archaeon]|nr:hypothetical protein [Desulfurococcales archaeon]
MPKINIYLCTVTVEKQVVSRHYTSSISVCRYLKTIELGYLNRFSPKLKERILREKEIEVVDQELLRNLVTDKEFKENSYLRLILVN